MQVVAIHAGDAIGEHHDPVVEVERGERGVEHAGIRVDTHQNHVLHAQRLQKLPQVGAVEAVEALLVVDDVVAVLVELGNDLRAGRALDVVLANGALPSRRQAVRLALSRVQRLPEGRGHAFAANAWDAAIDQHDVDHRNFKFSGNIQSLARIRDDPLGVFGLRGHGGHVHVEVAAVHVDGDDGSLGRLELELAI